MKRIAILVALTFLIVLGPTKLAIAANGFTVVPSVFDPHRTHLVAAEWEGGIGCPTNATVVPFAPPNFDTLGPPYSYTDPACPIGMADSSDNRNEGLLLVKTGPTNNDAAAGAELLGVKGTVLNELGYDIRKPGAPNFGDPRASRCDYDSPRFNIVLAGQPGVIYFIACASPPPDMDTPSAGGIGWQRLRWGGAAPALLAFSSACPIPINACDIKGKTVDSIEIILDEGDDQAPDNLGVAVLDNIDVNGALVGKGPEKTGNNDDDKVQGDDGKGDSVQSDDSQSHPESSSMSYEDQSKGMKMQSVNGARSGSVTYTGPCVSYAGDAVMNSSTGYVFAFEACGVSALGTTIGNLLGTGIGTFSMTVTGPAGYLYQKSAVLTSGSVNIHPH
jgi:hypothetical protein